MPKESFPMVLISATRLHVRSPRFFPGFAWYTLQTIWQTIHSPGFLGGKLMQDAHGGAWTLTLWQDDIAMKQFRNSGAHRRAMPLLQQWCDEAVVVHWVQAEQKLPDWQEAYQRMISTGHFTKLARPAAAHLERQIPEPTPHQGLFLRPRGWSGKKPDNSHGSGVR